MKNSLLIITFFFFALGSLFSQNFDWAQRWGNTSSNGCISTDIAVDNLGNIYTTGAFGGQVDFDPGVAVFNLTASGNGDAYITKLDPNGNFIWAIQFNGSGYSESNSIAIDDQGNVYTTGLISAQPTDFDPGAGTAYLSTIGGNSIFISKLDTDGNYLWAKSIGGSGDERGFSIELDNQGNPYIIGQFTSITDFDPGASVVNMSPVEGIDGFVLKMTSGGVFSWSKQISGTAEEVMEALTIDNSGNVIITGWYNGTIDLDPGIGTQSYSVVGNSNMFLIKLDNLGTLVYGNNFVSSYHIRGFGITTDNQNSIFITGLFIGIADFDSDAIGEFNLTSTGQDGFVLKLEATGLFQWVKQLITSSSCIPSGIAVNNNSVYTTGSYAGTLDLDPSAGNFSVSASGTGRDIYLSKLNTQGDFVWGGDFDGTSTYTNAGTGIALNNNIHISGNFMGTVDFDPNSGVANMSSLNNVQGSSFVVKLNPQCIGSTSTIYPVSCDSYIAPNSQVYTTTGNYIATIANAAGCDSTITINLTINTVDASANQMDALTLKATSTTANYEWVDCNNYFILINDETSQTFIATSNGSYAVIVTENGCSDTSACFIINQVGIVELNQKNPRQLLYIVDLMGRETLPVKNTVLIYIYNDGTSERIFELEN